MMFRYKESVESRKRNIRLIATAIGFILIMSAAVIIAPITITLQPSFTIPNSPNNTISKTLF